MLDNKHLSNIVTSYQLNDRTGEGKEGFKQRP